MGEIEGRTRATASTIAVRPDPECACRRYRAAIAVVVIAFAAMPARAADEPSTSPSSPLPLATPVDLRVDRAPIAVVLDQLAATAGLDGARVRGSAKARPTGPLAGSLRAVLAGLVAEHDLVLDVADDTLDTRSGEERRTVVLDVPGRDRPAADIEGTAVAADLPGNVVTSDGSTLVISGHPAFVARMEDALETLGATADAMMGAPALPAPPPADDVIAPNDGPVPNAEREIDPTPKTAAAPRAADTTTVARPATAQTSATVIRSVDDVPGFY